MHQSDSRDPDMTELRCGSWAELGAAARAIREAVFVHEQHIPAAMVCDDADDGAVHAVAFSRLGQALASGRLLSLGGGVAKIGRMATVRAGRGAGIGRQVLMALMQAARARGDTEVLLHAQASAVAFYLRAGYVCDGPPFIEADIPHQAMRMRL